MPSSFKWNDHDGIFMKGVGRNSDRTFNIPKSRWFETMLTECRCVGVRYPLARPGWSGACPPPTLFWRTNARHSRINPFPSALHASGVQSRWERVLGRPIVVRQNASVGAKPRTAGLAILSISIFVRNKNDSIWNRKTIETAIGRTARRTLATRSWRSARSVENCLNFFCNH